MQKTTIQANYILSTLRNHCEEEIEKIVALEKDFFKYKRTIERHLRLVAWQNKAREKISKLITRLTGTPHTIAPRETHYAKMLEELLTHAAFIQSIGKHREKAKKQLRALDHIAPMILGSEELATSCCRRAMTTKGRTALINGLLEDCGMPVLTV